ncbi:J domain-containing protein [Kribbella sp. NPDC058245]|uniref:J domain-containing protein n=1 Tax=Kribbella sp. NPDC058245 TaxID=3346399 RepID=UPI0036EE04F4
MSEPDHYEVLNVERTATAAEIKTAYRKLVRQVHPDQGGNAALFRVVQEAWNTLSDPEQRAAYDRKLAGGRPTDAPKPPRPDPEHSSPPPPQGPPTGTPDAERGQVWAVPRIGRFTVIAPVALAAWLMVAVAPFVYSTFSDGFDVANTIFVVAFVVVALPPHWQRRLPFRRWVSGCGALLAITLLVMTLPFAKVQLGTMSRAWIYVLVAGLLVVRILGSRWSKARELDRALGPDATYDSNVWGRPGEPLVDDGYTAPLASPDVLRHRQAAQLLEAVVLQLPAAKLIHGARVDGVPVDHLLLAGHRLAVISSVTWPPGNYSFDVYGSVLRNGQPFAGHDTALAGVVEAWRARSARGVEVRGYVVVLGNGPITVTAGQDITYLTASSAASELITWLQPDGNLIDRRVLNDILYRAPLDLG